MIFASAARPLSTSRRSRFVIGLAEVSRIKAEMSKLIAERGFENDMNGFVKSLTDSERLCSDSAAVAKGSVFYRQENRRPTAQIQDPAANDVSDKRSSGISGGQTAKAYYMMP